MFKRTFACCAALLVSGAAQAATYNVDGVMVEIADSAFADSVVASRVASDVFGLYDSPDAVLGVPDWDQAAFDAGTDSDGLIFSLGEQPGPTTAGFVTIEFTDNFLTNSGDSADDLFIFELGNAVESYGVEISQDNSTWYNLGVVTGQPSGIDIDIYPWIDGLEVDGRAKFSFVRVWDARGGVSSGSSCDNDGNGYCGPDIDAIAALSSEINPDFDVPLPASGWLLLGSIAAGTAFGRRRRR